MARPFVTDQTPIGDEKLTLPQACGIGFPANTQALLFRTVQLPDIEMGASSAVLIVEARQIREMANLIAARHLNRRHRVLAEQWANHVEAVQLFVNGLTDQGVIAWV